jgi:hypothetical protein
MSRISTPFIHLAAVLLTVAAAAGFLLLPADGKAERRTETLRIYEQARAIQLTKADGRVLSKLPIAETEPGPGDVLDIVFDVYRGTHTAHGEKPIGSDHLRCAFIAAGPPDCVSHVAFGSSMLVVTGNPGKVVLGTGRFFGASGRVISNREVKGVPPTQLAHTDIDVVARIQLGERR